MYITPPFVVVTGVCCAWKMNSLFKRALVWTAAFFIWICFSAWIFVQVEYSDVDEYEQKYQLLHSLYNSMAYKFNITIEEFNNFSKTAHEALSVPKLQWSYSTSFDFVFQTVTTIGKNNYGTARRS